MKVLLTLIFCAWAYLSIAQSGYKPGYMIKQDGTRVDCLIESNGKGDSPSTFYYKLSPDGQLQKGDVHTFKAFGIEGDFRLESYSILVDESLTLQTASRRAYLSKEKELTYTPKVVFLKVLVSGKATLYEYRKGALEKYFFRTQDTIPVQLIYKEYLDKKLTGEYVNFYFAQNTGFRKQLFEQVNCPGMDTGIESVFEMEFFRKNLIKYFEAYNSCAGSTSDQQDFTILQGGRKPRSNVPRVEFPQGNPNRFWIYGGGISTGRVFQRVPKSIRPVLGVEYEVFPDPFLGLSAFAGLEYQRLAIQNGFSNEFYPAEGTFTSTGTVIAVPIGFRYHVLKREESALYFQLSCHISGYFKERRIDQVVGMPDSSTLTLFNTRDVPPESLLQFGLGVGYLVSNKLSISFSGLFRRHSGWSFGSFDAGSYHATIRYNLLPDVKK